MWELLGLDAKSQARGEKSSLDSRRKGFETWDLGDRFRSAVTGVSREQLEKESRTLAEQDLQDEFGKKIEVLTSNLEGRGLTPTGMKFDGQTRGEIAGDIQTNQSRLTALTKLLGQKGGDSVKLAPGATTMDIVTAGRTLADTNTEAAEDKVEAEVRRQEGRSDSRYRDSQDLLLMQMSNQAADRQADREYRRDQQAYQNRKLDMQEARLDRKDRQAMIMQLMQGLSQMGASIAI